MRGCVCMRHQQFHDYVVSSLFSFDQNTMLPLFFVGGNSCKIYYGKIFCERQTAKANAMSSLFFCVFSTPDVDAIGVLMVGTQIDNT